VLSYLHHLEKVNRELDHFAYIVSHDLKAPLRAINSLALWIDEDIHLNNKENVHKNMVLLQGRIQRMEGLINGILDYSKANKTAKSEEKVDTRELLEEVLFNLAPPETFRITISNNMPEIYTDRIRLQQVFLNLISNAVKYHHSGNGNIHVGYSDQGEFCRFFVADDGPGIEPAYHEKIFVIFQKLHARDEVESTGVGLAIVKKIVEDMGGHIELKSDAGAGATFYFTWPKKLSEKILNEK
jgi:light-regulated signal transduction histidine kinase (bacteriophytochrome)